MRFFPKCLRWQDGEQRHREASNSISPHLSQVFIHFSSFTETPAQNVIKHRLQTQHCSRQVSQKAQENLQEYGKSFSCLALSYSSLDFQLKNVLNFYHTRSSGNQFVNVISEKDGEFLSFKNKHENGSWWTEPPQHGNKRSSFSRQFYSVASKSTVSGPRCTKFRPGSLALCECTEKNPSNAHAQPETLVLSVSRSSQS